MTETKTDRFFSTISRDCRRILIVLGPDAAGQTMLGDGEAHVAPVLTEHGFATLDEALTVECWRERRDVFCHLMAALYTDMEAVEPTPVHYFVRALADKKWLLRCYTLNIDSQERAAGVDEERIIYCLGNMQCGRCEHCGSTCDGDEMRKKCQRGEARRCDCRSYAKPDLVLLGERYPMRYSQWNLSDAQSCDLFWVIGADPYDPVVLKLAANVPNNVLRIFQLTRPPAPWRSKAEHGTVRYDFMNPDSRDLLMVGRCADVCQRSARRLHVEITRAAEAPAVSEGTPLLASELPDANVPQHTVCCCGVL